MVVALKYRVRTKRYDDVSAHNELRFNALLSLGIMAAQCFAVQAFNGEFGFLATKRYDEQRAGLGERDPPPWK
jgi:hypothetical protein